MCKALRALIGCHVIRCLWIGYRIWEAKDYTYHCSRYELCRYEIEQKTVSGVYSADTHLSQRLECIPIHTALYFQCPLYYAFLHRTLVSITTPFLSAFGPEHSLAVDGISAPASQPVKYQSLPATRAFADKRRAYYRQQSPCRITWLCSNT
jgi:hypothetical protein